MNNARGLHFRTTNASESLHWMTYQFSLAVSFTSFKCYSSSPKSNSKLSHLASPQSNAANYNDLGVKGEGGGGVGGQAPGLLCQLATPPS